GESHSLAVTTDGSVWAWGGNGSGQLGDGTTTDRATPARVGGLERVTPVAAGGGPYGSHSLALDADGTVWAWGDNSHGELGDGTTTSHPTPTRVAGLGRVTAIAAGDAHSLALLDDGSVWAWGNNDAGQLGDATTDARPRPVQVRGLERVTAIAAGTYFSLALTNDGSVWAWGANGSGQLGHDTSTSCPGFLKDTPCSVVPVPVRAVIKVKLISAGA